MRMRRFRVPTYPTTLITLVIVHITTIFIFPYLSSFKLNFYVGLLCKNFKDQSCLFKDTFNARIAEPSIDNVSEF